ncbi:hypothetical protein [Klenkia terrae]|uniref:Lipoprotein n=1 Tax=Klenkia terrae TaxID=1052259 RepID=A0ABU8E9U2_9ACTN|nr:hypothetical protein [Klenkia terrae]SSC22991.1 Hypothetical protein KLENKIAIHU_1586 [Klenkia terrae]
MRSGLPSLAVLLVVLAGCSAPADAPAAAPTTDTPAVTLPAVPGVEGEVVLLRTDAAVGGQVHVRLTDTGDAGFTLTSVALSSPAFAPQPASAQTAVYAPRRTIDLPVPFGAVDCAAAVQPVAAVVELDRGSGPEQVTVPLAGDDLELVFDAECAAQRLAEHVTLSVEGLVPDGDRVSGSVVLTRVDDGGDVVVSSVGRSVLLEPAVPDLPATLADGDDELTLPLTVGLATCDPHVLAETKKPFVFAVAVEAAGESAVVDLPLSDDQRAQLQELVDRVCG